MVPRSSVKVNDVTVGEVTEVDRVGWHASITMRIRTASSSRQRDRRHPPGQPARREVRRRGGPHRPRPVGRLSDGDDIPMSSTGRNPEVEEVLGALSFLLSGGGVGQIRTISVELNKVMSGRTGPAAAPARISSTRSSAPSTTRSRTSSRRSTRSTSWPRRSTASGSTLAAALDNMGPAIDVLRRPARQAGPMLRQLDRLGGVGTRVIGSTKDDLLPTWPTCARCLHKLNEAGDSLPQGLSLMISFPFPRGGTRSSRATTRTPRSRRTSTCGP